jgi:hypothetical protein
VFVRQLLEDDKVGKLDSFKDIPSAKKKGAEEEEEEEVVDLKRTKKKMDLGAGPSNASTANLGPVAPPAIESPSTLESSGNSSRGRFRLLRFGFSFSCSKRWSCGWKDQWYVFFWMEKVDPLFSCSVNLVVVGKSPVFPVIHEEHGCSSFP